MGTFERHGPTHCKVPTHKCTANRSPAVAGCRTHAADECICHREGWQDSDAAFCQKYFKHCFSSLPDVFSVNKYPRNGHPHWHNTHSTWSYKLTCAMPSALGQDATRQLDMQQTDGQTDRQVDLETRRETWTCSLALKSIMEMNASTSLATRSHGRARWGSALVTAPISFSSTWILRISARCLWRHSNTHRHQPDRPTDTVCRPPSSAEKPRTLVINIL